MSKISRAGKAAQPSISRNQRGRAERSAMFSVAPSRNEMLNDYAAFVGRSEAAYLEGTSACGVGQCWRDGAAHKDIGPRILDKQGNEGWCAGN